VKFVYKNSEVMMPVSVVMAARHSECIRLSDDIVRNFMKMEWHLGVSFMALQILINLGIYRKLTDFSNFCTAVNGKNL